MIATAPMATNSVKVVSALAKDDRRFSRTAIDVPHLENLATYFASIVTENVAAGGSFVSHGRLCSNFSTPLPAREAMNDVTSQ
jgi:hypothetical protein